LIGDAEKAGDAQYMVIVS